ncbi:hypothetical protein B0A55_09705 [Friedmanniomyces simplex]|uniref:Uncharacterized protein n=1 Tax=Friedmanniomyces simplex TaxID=329884 RepID=A0A4U0WW07_9PEZI|nr:hypothetical protein B0A55_09705 [Friedmanniomyces simplex]
MAGIDDESSDAFYYDGPDRFFTLSTELLDRIVGFLFAPGDQRDLNKTDLQAVNLSCKKVQAAATPRLFEHLGVSIRLMGDLPPVVSNPHPDNLPEKPQWAVRQVLQTLREAPMMKPLVKSLQLRIEPFPVKDWNDQQFDALHMQLLHAGMLPCLGIENASDWLVTGLRYGPSTVERRRWVVCAFYIFWVAIFVGRPPDWYEVVQSALPHVAAVLELLPNVQHVEAGRWHD